MESSYDRNTEAKCLPTTFPAVTALTELNTFANVNVIHVFPSDIYTPATQVITMAPSADKAATRIHPVEMKEERSEVMQPKNILLSVNTNQSSVIQAANNNAMRGSIITSLPNSFFTSEPQILTDKKMQFIGDQKIVWLGEIESHDTGKDQIPLTVQSCKEELKETAKIVWVDSSSQVNSAGGEEDDASSQIPLTVEKYAQNETKGNAVDEDEEENDYVEAVADDEPDPESDPLKIVKEIPEDPSKIKCNMCFKAFTLKKNMYAHVRRIHSTQPNIQGGIVCPLCKMHALRQEHLRSHLEQLHNIKIEFMEKKFTSFEEFQDWKKEIERNTTSLFISKSSAKLLANNQTKLYYKCHRSGSYYHPNKIASDASNSNGQRKKRMKSQGSYKIEATCPAAMEVLENNQGITVKFWSTHVGHEMDLAHLTLTKDDRSKVSEMLARGMNLDEILEKLKNDSSISPEKITRLQFLSKQDIRNLKRSRKDHSLDNAQEKINGVTRKQKLPRRASQAVLIEKAYQLVSALESTEIVARARPTVALMLDNIISTVKRRAVKSENDKRPKDYSKNC